MARTVIVGCKLANGILLELNGKKVQINGANSAQLIGGHGITEGVDGEFMDAWLSAHKELSFVKGGFLFVHDKAVNASAEAKEKAEEKTGMEPLPPMKEGGDNDKAGGLSAVSKD